MIRTAAISALLLLLASCSLVDSVTKGDAVVTVGDAVLYGSDLEKVMPRGASATDSAAFVKQYISSWTLKQLLLQKAQKELPKSDRDVEKLLEDYRTQLLVFRYEDEYIRQRLDTLVDERERKEYYSRNSEHFLTEEGVVKGYFVKFHNSSPNLQKARALLVKGDAESMERLMEMAFMSAFGYNGYSDSWVDLSVAAGDMEMNISDFLSKARSGKIIEKRDSVYSNFMKIVDFVEPGEPAPFEYCSRRIGEIILNKRKQELIKQLHKEIYNEALLGGTVKYKEDEDN